MKQGSVMQRIMRCAKWAAVGWVMVFLSGSGLAYAITGEEAVQKVQDRYDKTKRLSLRFERTFRWKLTDEVQHFEGAFYFKKPNRFRLETSSQVIVTDGKALWIYTPSNQQVLVEPYQKESGMSGLEGFLSAFSEGYVPTYTRDERVKDHLCHVLLLRPKEPDSYIREITAWVDPEIWFVRKIQYVDINGDTTTYELTSLKVDSKLDDGIFVFTVPEGVDVVDMR